VPTNSTTIGQYPKRQDHASHGDQRDCVLQQASHAFDQDSGTVRGFLARAM
jgi:hypothetical protein